MTKVRFGLLLGGGLGVFDGLTALVTAPETAPHIASIVLGSTVKGLIAGTLIGYVARRWRSMPIGLAAGLGIGLLLAFLVALANEPHYYWQIMAPGGILGEIVGYATQRYPGRVPDETDKGIVAGG